MKLASVEVIPYALPFKEPYVTATGTLSEREMILLRLRDADGVVGLGEAVPLSLRGGVGLEQVVRELEGLDESGGLDRAVQKWTEEAQFDREWERFDEDRGLSLPARCAVLTALVDLSERRDAIPAGPRGGVAITFERHDPGPVPCNATLVAGEPAAVAEDALRWADEGFTTFKLKVGGSDDVGQVRAVREALGENCRIRIDVNAAWSLEQAQELLRQMEPLDIEFVEQPVRRMEEAAQLAWQTSIPIAGDENIVNREDAALAVRWGAYRLAGIKLSKVGGLPEGHEIASIMHSYVSSALDGPVGIAAGARLAQCIHYEGMNPYAPRFAHGLATQRLFASTVASVECELRGDMLHPPDGPGLGVEIDEDALQAHRL